MIKTIYSDVRDQLLCLGMIWQNVVGLPVYKFFSFFPSVLGPHLEVLRSSSFLHSWIAPKSAQEHMWCQGSKLGMLQTRQVPYPWDIFLVPIHAFLSILLPLLIYSKDEKDIQIYMHFSQFLVRIYLVNCNTFIMLFHRFKSNHLWAWEII